MEIFWGEPPPPSTEPLLEILRYRNQENVIDLNVFRHRTLDNKMEDRHDVLFGMFNRMNERNSQPAALTEEKRKQQHRPSPSPTPSPQISYIPSISDKRKRPSKNEEEDHSAEEPSTTTRKRQRRGVEAVEAMPRDEIGKHEGIDEDEEGEAIKLKSLLGS
ncbi:MAG: hypothetical protein Q9217_006952 [Psora testacea]